jgi:hypothetical protein
VGALVDLQADTLAVEPGRTATTQLGLRNTGTIVEQFTIMVLGDAAEWTESDPPVVSLFPGAQETVTLRFSPPRNYTTPSGPVPFGVKVIPSNEPEESVTEEGELTVGSFNDVGAELVPRVATGRLTGHQKVAVDSRGNIALPVLVTAIDAADALKFKIRPDKVTTAPGEARYIKVRVKPRQLFWKGHDQHKPYKVQVAAANESPLVLDGALTQKAVFPKWFWPALLIASALLLLWFFVLKPIVHNDAVNANKAALASQQAQTKALAGQVAQANASAQQANTRANQAAAAAALANRKPAATTTTTTTTVPKAVVKVAPAAATTTTATTTTTTVAPAPAPPPSLTTVNNSGYLDITAGPFGQTASTSMTVGPNSTLAVADVVIQNVNGTPGRAVVQRQGVAAAGAPPPSPQTLLVENLANLTDQEYQFGTPLMFSSGQKLILSVFCEGQLACEVDMLVSGPLTEPVTATTAP